MSSRFIRITSLTFALIMTTGTYAQMSNTPCPSISSIHQAAEKINAVTKVMGSYSINTSPDVINENNISWGIWITGINVNSRDEAIVSGSKP
jgi:hypothetical protein